MAVAKRKQIVKSKKKSVEPLSKKGKKSGDSAYDAWDLRLYIAGQTPKSIVAIANLKKICEEHLQGRYQIEIIDLMKDPARAQNDQILAIPTLIRSVPEPLKRIIGDLSRTERTLVGLEIIKQDGVL